ncbi:MAG: hypothetical protein WCJ59_02390 [bacterium]
MTNEKQLDAILELSTDNEEKMSEAIVLKQDKNGNIKTDIKPELIKKVSKMPYYIKATLAVVVFILGVLFIKDPISVNLLIEVADYGLLAVLASNYLSTFRGSMWYFGGTGTIIDKPTPIFLIEFVGWIMLFIPVISEIISKF